METTGPYPAEPAEPLEERLAASLPRLEAHLAKRTSESDDAVQEVMARALRYRSSFDGSRPLWPWLKRLGDRVLHDQARAREQRPSALADLEPKAPVEPAAIETTDEVRVLLAQLRPLERETLLRFHTGGETVAEIATALDIPAGTVKSSLSRARKRLADLPRPTEERK